MQAVGQAGQVAVGLHIVEQVHAEVVLLLRGILAMASAPLRGEVAGALSFLLPPGLPTASVGSLLGDHRRGLLFEDSAQSMLT